MSLAQQVLIRALIARLWHSPAGGDLTRWGTALHDRFMLPHFVWEDFLDVLRDLREHGFDLRPDWYEAQAEFRFPFCGEVEYEGVETRNPPGARTVARARRDRRDRRHGALHRLVDRTPAGQARDHRSGAIRGDLQQAPRAAQEDRDRRRLRRRACASRPGSRRRRCIRCFPVDAPLTFDIFDTWTGRALGGCVYHVAHPGGRNYETFPVNGNEAEARRLARFEARGHTPGAYVPPAGSAASRIPHDARPAAAARYLKACKPKANASPTGPSTFCLPAIAAWRACPTN